jgi:uncharacterized YigZ family protein
MKTTDTYLTIKAVSQGIFRDKGSKFIALAHPASNLDEIKSIIDETRKEYHDARHHCYAYVIGRDGSDWRANDDGEPTGSAGRQILGQIRSFGLTNVLIVVTRYFGGTLLGVSGLINAYKMSAGSALENAEIIEHIIKEHYELSFPYSAMNDIMKIIKEEDAGQAGHDFDSECRITISFRESHKEKILGRLTRIENLTWRYLSTG